MEYNTVQSPVQVPSCLDKLDWAIDGVSWIFLQLERPLACLHHLQNYWHVKVLEMDFVFGNQGLWVENFVFNTCGDLKLFFFFFPF